MIDNNKIIIKNICDKKEYSKPILKQIGKISLYTKGKPGADYDSGSLTDQALS